MITLYGLLANFNTSNVTIQHIHKLQQETQLYHFNTSNVTIQLYLSAEIIGIYKNFNTSNVTIQPPPNRRIGSTT